MCLLKRSYDFNSPEAHYSSLLIEEKNNPETFKEIVFTDVEEIYSGLLKTN